MPPDDLADEARRLGGLVNGHPEHLASALPRLTALLAAADDPEVERAAVEALGHAWDAAAAAALLDLVPRDHPDPAVRLALAQALPGGVADDGELRDRVVGALVELARDDAARVRDWAAFGLGQLRADTPAARDALVELLDDPDDDARCEALLALAVLGDDRARPALLARLGGDDGPFTLELEAAAALADPELHPVLGRWSRAWADDPEDDFTEPLRLALTRCHPAAAGRARRVEQEVLDLVRRLDLGRGRVEMDGAYPATHLVVAPDAGPELRVELWDDREEPDRYATHHVVNAVLGTLGPRHDGARPCHPSP